MKTERLPWRATARGTSSLSRIGAGLLVVMACGALPAQATGQELRSSIDAAGSSISRQLGEWLGGKPQPKPRGKSTRKAATREGRTTVPAAAPLPTPRPDVDDKASIEQAAVEPTAKSENAGPSGQPASAMKDKAPASPAKPAQTEKTVETEKQVAQPAKSAAASGKPVAAAVPLPAPRPTQDATPDEKTEEMATETMAPPQPAPKALSTARPAPVPDALPSANAAPAASAQARAPLPPARPFPAAGRERVAALPPPTTMETEKDEAASGEDTAKAPLIPTICPELSNENLGVFTPVTVTATQAACTVDRGVSLSAVRMKDGRLVPLEPPAVLRCEMAGAVARWLRDSVDPLVDSVGSPLDKVKVAASQQCRSRNRVAGAKISEHGRGNALDTAGYVMKDGRELMIGGTGDTAMTPDFQEKLKASACADFTTILGPGSDGYHEKHLHVDRAERRSGAVLCQWAVSTGKGR